MLILDKVSSFMLLLLNQKKNRPQQHFDMKVGKPESFIETNSKQPCQQMNPGLPSLIQPL